MCEGGLEKDKRDEFLSEQRGLFPLTEASLARFIAKNAEDLTGVPAPLAFDLAKMGVMREGVSIGAERSFNGLAAAFQYYMRRHGRKFVRPTEFTEEQRESLRGLGYTAFYKLSGKSLEELRNWNSRFCLSWREKRMWYGNSYDWNLAPYQCKEMTSQRLEVAFNPDYPFIPKQPFMVKYYSSIMGERIRAPKIIEIIQWFQEQLAKEVSNVDAIIGEGPDYIELAFQHLEKTDEMLFGEKFDYNYAISRTHTNCYTEDWKQKLLTVGEFTAKSIVLREIHGNLQTIVFEDQFGGEVYPKVRVLPLLIPAEQEVASGGS